MSVPLLARPGADYGGLLRRAVCERTAEQREMWFMDAAADADADASCGCGCRQAAEHCVCNAPGIGRYKRQRGLAWQASNTTLTGGVV